MTRRSQAMPRAFALAAGLLLSGLTGSTYAAEDAAKTADPVKPAVAVITAGAIKTDDAVQPATASTPLVPPAPSTVNIAGLEWRTNYAAAYRAAKQNKRMLLVNVVGPAGCAEQCDVEAYIARYASMQSRLARVERLRVPVDATIAVGGQSQRLLGFPAFAELQGGPGFVLIDLHNVGAPYYGGAVNVLPFAGGKYYHWRDDYLAVALDLPPGSITQRTMIWAVRIHPEQPASTVGMFHPQLASGAENQSNYQAAIGVQGHHNFESRYAGLSVTGGEVSEVVAESWPDENMIDSCIDCVDSWRHSPGHWNGVVHRHRAFGYDIRRGRNGIWYGTGIFSD